MSDKLRKLKDDAARHLARGKLDDAAETFVRIVRADPRDLVSRQRLAEIFARLGKKHEAVGEYQSVAGCYAADGLLLKAIAICKIILQIDPSHKETQAILADLSVKRRGGDVSGASVEMPKAMSSALPSGKKSANAIRGVSAHQIRGVAPAVIEAARAGRFGDAEEDVAMATGAPTGSLEAPVVPAVPPAQGLGRPVATATTDLMLGTPPTMELPTGAAATVAAPAVAFTIPTAPALGAPASIDDLPIDIAFENDAEPVVVGSLAEPGPPGARITVGSFATDSSLPPDEQLPAGDTAEDLLVTDDDADVVELSDADVVPARVDVEQIPPIPLFSDLSRDAFIALAERMELRTASIGDVLIAEGEQGTSMFVIIQGRVRVARNVSSGDLVLAELSDGAFFGEMALLSDAPRTASVVCVDDTMLFEISRDLLQSMIREHPSVAEVMQRFHKNRLLTNLLKTSPIFAPFSSTDKKLLIEKFKSRLVQAGSYLVTRERPGEGLYVVLSGRCEVLDADEESGREKIIAELKEGDVFGEMSMLWNQQTCASVRAQTPCIVLRLPKGTFNEVIMTHPQILETLSSMSDRRQRQNLELHAAGIASDVLI